MQKTTLALILALTLLAGCLTGCGKNDSGTPTTTTTTATTSSSTTAPENPEPDAVPVEHEHCGLRVKLDDSFTVGLDEEDRNTFTFSNETVSGTVAFAPLATLAGDATTSKEYAQALKEKYGEDNARMGTSTNVAFYVIHEDDAGITVEGLYIYGDKGWMVTARSADENAVNQLVKIVGLCGINADLIPVE